MNPQVVRYSERPGLWESISEEQWESWTRLRFPETGDYVFPAGLATVHIDRDNDLGKYWEPNIWIIHPPIR